MNTNTTTTLHSSNTEKKTSDKHHRHHNITDVCDIVLLYSEKPSDIRFQQEDCADVSLQKGQTEPVTPPIESDGNWFRIIFTEGPMKTTLSPQFVINSEGKTELNGSNPNWKEAEGEGCKFEYQCSANDVLFHIRICLQSPVEPTKQEIILVGTVPTLPDDDKKKK